MFGCLAQSLDARTLALRADRTATAAVRSRALCERAHVRRLRALLPLRRLELHLRSLRQALEALAGDAAVMDEEVLAAIVGRDEAIALLVVEPLDGSCCHLFSLPAWITNKQM